MILRKCCDGDEILGLKVNGGILLPNGDLAAIVDDIKRGSIADLDGHLKPGEKIISFFCPILYNCVYICDICVW